MIYLNKFCLLAFISLVTVTYSGSKLDAETKKTVTLKIGRILFMGGDGSSIERAVVIKKAKNEMEGIAAEGKWIKKMHRGWRKISQALLNKNGKQYDRIKYKTRDGKKVVIFFDITDFFGKF